MINHKSALRTQLQCDAWASLSGLHSSVLWWELNYPLRPALLLLSLLSSLSIHCQTLPFYTPWSNTVFCFFYHRTTPSHSHFPNVGGALHIGKFITLHSYCTSSHHMGMLQFPSCLDWEACQACVTQAVFKPWIQLLCFCMQLLVQ